MLWWGQGCHAETSQPEEASGHIEMHSLYVHSHSWCEEHVWHALLSLFSLCYPKVCLPQLPLFFNLFQHLFLYCTKSSKRHLFALDCYHMSRTHGINQMVKIIKALKAEYGPTVLLACHEHQGKYRVVGPVLSLPRKRPHHGCLPALLLPSSP